MTEDKIFHLVFFRQAVTSLIANAYSNFFLKGYKVGLDSLFSKRFTFGSTVLRIWPKPAISDALNTLKHKNVSYFFVS